MDDLTALIHSLTKAEQRQVTLTSARYSGSKKYLDLFDSIRGKKLRKPGLPYSHSNALDPHDAYSKNYLQHIVIETLKGLHSQRTIRSLLHNRILDVEVLIQKNQLSLAQRVIIKAKKQAASAEEYGVLIELLRLEAAILMRRNLTSYQPLRKIESEVLAATRKQQDIIALRVIHKELQVKGATHARAVVANAAAVYDRIIDHPLLKGFSEKEGVILLLLRCLILGRYHLLYGAPDLTLAYCSKAIKKYESFANRISNTSEDTLALYKEAVVLRTFCLLELGNIRQTLTYIAKVEQCHKNDMGVLINLLLIKCDVLLLKGDIQAVRDVMLQLEALKSKVPNDLLEARCNYTMARMYFLMGEYKLAIEVLNRVVLSKKYKVFHLIYLHCRSLHLLCNVELDNKRYVGFAVRSLKQYTYRKGERPVLLEHLLKIANKGKNNLRLQDWIKLREVLYDMTYVTGKAVNVEGSDIQIWIESKIQGKSCLDVIASRKKPAVLR